MKNKVRIVTIAGILLIVALALLPFWIRGRGMENRHKADSELFQTTAEAFCNKSMEIDRQVCVYKSDSIKEISDEYGFSKLDISGIKKFFARRIVMRFMPTVGRRSGRTADLSMGEMRQKPDSSISQM